MTSATAALLPMAAAAVVTALPAAHVDTARISNPIHRQARDSAMCTTGTSHEVCSTPSCNARTPQRACHVWRQEVVRGTCYEGSGHWVRQAEWSSGNSALPWPPWRKRHARFAGAGLSPAEVLHGHIVGHHDRVLKCHWVYALHEGGLLHHGQLHAALLLCPHGVVLPILRRHLSGHALRVPCACMFPDNFVAVS